jgi:hypothetical protein
MVVGVNVSTEEPLVVEPGLFGNATSGVLKTTRRGMIAGLFSGFSSGFVMGNACAEVLDCRGSTRGKGPVEDRSDFAFVALGFQNNFCAGSIPSLLETTIRS